MEKSASPRVIHSPKAPEVKLRLESLEDRFRPMLAGLIFLVAGRGQNVPVPFGPNSKETGTGSFTQMPSDV